MMSNVWMRRKVNYDNDWWDDIVIIKQQQNDIKQQYAMIIIIINRVNKSIHKITLSSSIRINFLKSN